MKTTSNWVFGVVIVLALSLSACAPRIAVSPSLWSQQGVRVGVATVVHPEAAAHKVGAQGLLDLAINAAIASELKAHLETVRLDEFDAIRDRFAGELQSRGLQAKLIPSRIDLTPYEQFVTPAGATAEFFEKNLKTLAEKESIDLLVLLSVTRFGTIRSYYGFVPLGPPQGLCQASGRLIDLRTNQLMWRTFASEKDSMVPAEGTWDQPPDYRNLTDAIKKAITNAQSFLFNDFFAETPAAQKK